MKPFDNSKFYNFLFTIIMIVLWPLIHCVFGPLNRPIFWPLNYLLLWLLSRCVLWSLSHRVLRLLDHRCQRFESMYIPNWAPVCLTAGPRLWCLNVEWNHYPHTFSQTSLDPTPCPQDYGIPCKEGLRYEVHSFRDGFSEVVLLVFYQITYVHF